MTQGQHPRTPQQLRKALIDLDDAARGLPSDAFAEKHALRSEADEVRAELQALLSDDLDAVNADWAQRAGRKKAHTVDHNVKQAIVASGSSAD